MFPLVPSLVLVLLLAAPALLTPTTSQELQVRGHRTPRDTKQDAIKVVISEGCANQGDSSDVSQGGKEIDLSPGSPIVLTHKIKLVPSGSGSGSCGCETDFAALRERLERLEREVSALREKCGGAEGGCCTSKESKGAGCSIKPDIDECPNECSDQGRCVDGKCVCFPGYSGLDCSESNCPGNCNDNGRCVNGQCVCDPGFSGPDCSQRGCPDNCNGRGRCVKGRCVCDSGFAGPSCSDESCPGNCNNRGRCVNGKCVCKTGFTGPDCSKRGCPDNCSDHGRCVNGKCVCNSGFTGVDCSETSCPGNCNNRGRCVNGECVCNEGFGGPDCSEIICPNDCYDRGRCVNGVCVCDSGFTGEDCSEASCPGNCNNRGRCVDGQCVCNSGFTGEDCSEVSCPGNCNNRGRCVNGQCVCDAGFTGEDCSEVSCPGNCNNKGRCVNGQCVCDAGFTGEDCSEVSCPGNCNNRGRCVNGQCVCNDGFTGEDCSEKACPKNCNNRGKCVNGKCVCDVGFAGPDCAAKGCPDNCNNKGRCVKGRCVCRRGFTGPDCSQCEEGMTGPNCDTAMSGVSTLSTRDITETSVTLVWTPPPVQYETYYITFSSQKESDQKITAQVEGSLTTFTQTGLAAGQEYTVSITGQIDGRRGAESTAEFMTLISGPTNLKVVKTTTTSAVVQWEQSLGEIDRYRLTVTPNDGAGRSQEMTIPSDQNSAHIQQLEAGRLYDIILTAEKGSSRSKPATTQVTPVTMAALTMQGLVTPGQDVGDRDQESDPSPEVQVFDRQGRREDESEADSSATVIARTKPLVVSRNTPDGTRPTFSKKPNVPGSFRFNTTRVVPGTRRFGPGPLKKPPRKVPIVPKKTKPGVPTLRNKTLALTGRDPRVETSSTEREDAKNPAVMSGTDSVTNGQSSSEGQTLGTKAQPDVGMAGPINDTAPVSSGPTGTVQRQEKKCLNKIKVTHVRLPLKDKGSGCRGDGTVLGGKTPGSNQGSSETDDSAEKDVDDSQDPLHKLVKDTFDKLNITTFSVHHLAQPSTFSVDAESVRMQILGGLKPLPLSSSDEPSSSLPSSSESPSAAPSTSASFSSSDESGSVGSKEPDIDYSKSTTDVAKPEDRKVPPSGKGGIPLFRRTSGYVRRPRPNIGWFQNKTHLSLRTPHPTPNLNLLPARETETSLTSTGELLSSTSSSASEESVASVEVSVPARDTSGYIDEATAPASSGVEQNKKKVPTERGRTPLRRTPFKGGYLRNPNFGPLWNRTRPISRLLPPPSQPLIPAAETRKEQVSSSELLVTSTPPVSKESHSAEGTGPIKEANEDRVGTSMSTEVSQTLRGSGEPSSHQPTTKVGYMRRPYGGRYQNQNRTNLRPPQHPYRGPVRKPFPARKLNGGSGLPVRSQTSQLEKSSTPEIPDNQSVEQGSPIPTQGVQINQSGEQVVTEVILTAQTEGVDSTVRVQTNELEGGDNAPVQTIKSGEEKTRTPDSYSDIHTERLSAGEDPGSTSRDIPSLKQTSHSRPVSEREDSGSVQTIKIGEKQTRTPDSDSEIYKESISDEDTGSTSRGRPTLKQTSNSEHGVSRPVLELGDSTPVRTTETGEEETRSPDSNSVSDIYKERVNAGENTGSTNQGRPTLKETSDSTPVSERGDSAPTQTTETGEEETRTPDSNSDVHKERVSAGEMTGSTSRGRPTLKQTSNLRHGASKQVPKLGDKAPVQTIKSGEEQTGTPDSRSDSDIYKKRITAGGTAGYTNRGRPTMKQTSDSRHGGSRLGTPPKRQPPTRINPMRHYISGSQKTNYTAKRLTDSETDQRSTNPKPLTGSDVSSSGVMREPLDYVGVTNRTSDGFTLTWDSPEGKYKNFVVTKKAVKKGPKLTEDQEDKEVSPQPIKEADNGRVEDENRVPESTQVPTAKPLTGSDETFKRVLPGSARSFQFDNLPRQNEYTVTLLGKGPGLLSKLHKLVISTGPEPPTNIIFSKVTENSLTVSWTKPKSPISGFKVTYTHTEDGEPVSVSVDKEDSTLGLTQLSPGSTYEVSVISILGLDESDPIKDFVMTLPDPPTNLRAVNVTDTKALLLWRPALAAIDKYSIVYGAGTGSELRVSVSGNAAEQQLSGLEGSTTYTVTITSQLGSRESSPATTTFTTAGGSGGDGDRPGDLRARDVTPRTALLSWKPPSNPVGRYRLTYQTEGQEMKEVIVDASVTEYNLTRLYPASKYMVQLQAETGGRYTAAIVTDFTTGTLKFPFPTDCSQELLNGIRTSGEVEIFLQGKPGTSMMVYCDMETDGGGWTVFQRRKDGSVDFFRGWKEYMRGFGDLSGEFWLGLDNLHNLTTMTRMTLRVDLRDKDESVFAKYSTFEVAKRNYRLSVGGYSGTAGDSLSYHNNRVFSTRDRDPAPFITRCAMSYRGGWWYKNCHEANLNGLYGIDVKHQGVIWTSWKGKDHSIPFTEMKMRPAAFSPPIRG